MSAFDDLAVDLAAHIRAAIAAAVDDDTWAPIIDEVANQIAQGVAIDVHAVADHMAEDAAVGVTAG